MVRIYQWYVRIRTYGTHVRARARVCVCVCVCVRSHALVLTDDIDMNTLNLSGDIATTDDVIGC